MSITSVSLRALGEPDTDSFLGGTDSFAGLGDWIVFGFGV
jgi:hypothetical protein